MENNKQLYSGGKGISPVKSRRGKKRKTVTSERVDPIPDIHVSFSSEMVSQQVSGNTKDG